MRKRKVYVTFLAVCLITLLFGYVFAEMKSTETAKSELQVAKSCTVFDETDNVNFNWKTSNSIKVAVNPCIPSGWWCEKNLDCCSKRCRNNICD